MLHYLSIFTLILTLTSSSCAKVNYLLIQGMGQWSLLHEARENEEVLKDENISEEDKEKIRQIQSYKTFFYRYLKKKGLEEEEDIYSKTTFLKTKAVSYLVIASKHNRVQAKEECFPFTGCFPYLGFFDLESAKEYQRTLEKREYVTYRRPVYAYSSLGYFTDPILSSFLLYRDFELAEMIFHELFHTIFFIEDEVPLNENLANYFSQEMAFEYFKLDELKQRKKKAERNQRAQLNESIVRLAQELDREFQEKKTKTPKKSRFLFDDFMKRRFWKEIEKDCQALHIPRESCFPLKKVWNNASLAAFLTYRKRAHDIEQLHKKQLGPGVSLVAFLAYLEGQYRRYRDDDGGKKKNLFPIPL